MKRSALIVGLILAFITSFSQKKDPKVIQFSGYVVTADSLMGVPFVHITVLHRGRVTTAGPDGFFSFVTYEGDTLFFTSIGFKPSIYIVPKNLENEKFSVVQLMTKSEIYLPRTLILPWRREDFHEVFMNTHPPEDDLDRAKKNLEHERLAALGAKMEADGPEMAEQNLRQSSAKTYYYGQVAPQNIFNPLAWAEFIKSWQRGDYKKKDNNSTITPTNTDDYHDNNQLK